MRAALRSSLGAGMATMACSVALPRSPGAPPHPPCTACGVSAALLGGGDVSCSGEQTVLCAQLGDWDGRPSRNVPTDQQGICCIAPLLFSSDIGNWSA